MKLVILPVETSGWKFRLEVLEIWLINDLPISKGISTNNNRVLDNSSVAFTGLNDINKSVYSKTFNTSVIGNSISNIVPYIFDL